MTRSLNVRQLLYILPAFFILSACSILTVQPDNEKYIDHPASKDSLCISEVSLAKKDFESGKLNFCVPPDWYTPSSRMYPILDSLCRQHGLILKPGTGEEHPIHLPNFTYGCYSRFMDGEIAKRFGNEFREHLISLADSIFIAKSINDTVTNYHCDIRPILCNEDIEQDFFSHFVYPTICKFDSLCSERDKGPGACYYRVLCVVDTNGHATDYEFCCRDSSISSKCANEIESNITASLEKINCWRPGILGNHKVISYGDLLIDFTRKDIRQ